MDIAFITKYLPMYEKAAILTVYRLYRYCFCHSGGTLLCDCTISEDSNCAAAGYGLYRDQP